LTFSYTLVFTKVVARTVQLLSKNRDDEHLIGDAEEHELADASEA